MSCSLFHLSALPSLGQGENGCLNVEGVGREEKVEGEQITIKNMIQRHA